MFNYYGDENKNVINEYFDFLKEIDAAFFASSIDETKLYSSLNFEEFTFSKISNAIIFDTSLKNQLKNFVFKLEKLNCTNILIIYDAFFNENIFFEVMDCFENTTFRHVELCFPYNSNICLYKFEELLLKRQRCGKILFFNAPNNELIEYLLGHSMVEFSKSDLFAKIRFARINQNSFFVNQAFFTEAQQHNTCLNRKLSIDQDGYIKNCPYMQHHYEHISNTDIAKVVDSTEFQKWWHIKKDDIDVCKDCEFRYMCTDCRVFIKDPENIYSQPAKCPYNPYICKWEGEEGYVPVEECGTYSRETGFVPDKKKIKKLNKQIWGDD